MDHRKGYWHFILTGSTVPPKAEEIFHSGAGLFAKLKMHTISLYESGESTGAVSLSDLFNGKWEPAVGNSPIDINHLAFFDMQEDGRAHWA